jgi:hypothetical protein
MTVWDAAKYGWTEMNLFFKIAIEERRDNVELIAV